MAGTSTSYERAGSRQRAGISGHRNVLPTQENHGTQPEHAPPPQIKEHAPSPQIKVHTPPPPIKEHALRRPHDQCQLSRSEP
jgi:hypothetical protein